MSSEDAQSPGLDSAIEAIWLKHRPLMFARMDNIDAAVEALSAGSLDEETRVTAQRDAHKLAGALGTFGLHDGTLHARTLEHALEQDGIAAEAPAVAELEDLRKAARGLRAQLESRPS